METDFVNKPNLSLLIVDDHALFREGLLLMFLVYQELRAVGAVFQDAQSSIEQYKPDVIIFGLGAKHGTFWAIIKTMCDVRPDLRLLILDETVRTRNIRTALELGIRGYWTKHATFAEIAESVRRLAAGQNSFCPEVDRYLFRTRHGLRYHPAHTGSPLQMLTRRETELLALLAQGLTLKDCSERMGIKLSTVDNHKTRLMRKLGVHKTVDLARLAVREGLIEEG
jgi:DNA-binding NarL/FixJ family response regulator